MHQSEAFILALPTTKGAFFLLPTNINLAEEYKTGKGGRSEPPQPQRLRMLVAKPKRWSDHSKISDDIVPAHPVPAISTGLLDIYRGVKQPNGGGRDRTSYLLFCK